MRRREGQVTSLQSADAGASPAAAEGTRAPDTEAPTAPPGKDMLAPHTGRQTQRAAREQGPAKE